MTGTNNSANHQVTQYNLITGGASNLLNNVAPSATSGVPVISQGSSANPTFGTAVVAGGGTGATSLTDHGVLVGSGTSPIDALAVGATGTVLGGVTGADPAFTATPSVTSITFGAGSALGNYIATTAWTPTVVGSTGAGTANYTIQVGQYVRIGSLVYVMFSLQWNTGTGTGNLLIGGLPIAPNSGTAWRPVGDVQLGSAAAPPANTVDVQAIIAGDVSSSNIFIQTTDSSGNGQNVSYPTAGSINGSIWYFA